MSRHVFLQRFAAGVPAPLPYRPTIDFLSRFGSLQPLEGDMQLTFSPRGVLAQANVDASVLVIGNAADGIGCIAIESDCERDGAAAWLHELVQRFDVALFDDSLDAIYVKSGTRCQLPDAMIAACSTGLRHVADARQLWPAAVRARVADVAPATLLPYADPFGDGVRHQPVDMFADEGRHIAYGIELHPAACSPPTLRAIRHAMLRIERVRRNMHVERVDLRFQHQETCLLTMEAPKVGDLDGPAMLVSAPPPVLGGDGTLQPTPRFAAHRDADGIARHNAQRCLMLARRLGTEPDTSGSASDWIDRLVPLLRGQLQQAGDPSQAAQILDECAWQLGCAWGDLVCRQVGGQWGYLMLADGRHLVVQTYRGRQLFPLLRAVDALCDASGESLSTQLQQLVASDRSPSLDHDDFVGRIPALCAVVNGRVLDGFTDFPLSAALPLSEFDYSPGSLHSLDRWLRQVGPQRHRFGDEQMISVLHVAGAYLGEVLRELAPQQWHWENHHDYFDGTPGLPDVPYQPVTAAVMRGFGRLLMPIATIGDCITDPAAPSLHDWLVKQMRDSCPDWAPPQVTRVASDGRDGHRLQPLDAGNAAGYASLAATTSADGTSPLDFSIESLVDVERRIDRLRIVHHGAVDRHTAEQLYLFGCYVGEVLVREYGAQWRPLEGCALAEHSDAAIVLQTRYGSLVDPISRVFERARSCSAPRLPWMAALVGNEFRLRGELGSPSGPIAAVAPAPPPPQARSAAAKSAAAAPATRNAAFDPAHIMLPPNRPTSITPLFKVQLTLMFFVGPLAGMWMSQSGGLAGLTSFAAVSGGAALWARRSR